MRYESDYTNYSDTELVQELNGLMEKVDSWYYGTEDPLAKESFRLWYALLQEASGRIE